MSPSQFGSGKGSAHLRGGGGAPDRGLFRRSQLTPEHLTSRWAVTRLAEGGAPASCWTAKAPTTALRSTPFKRPDHGVASRWERNQAIPSSARINRRPRI